MSDLGSQITVTWVPQMALQLTVLLSSSLPESPTYLSLGSLQNITSFHPMLCGSPRAWGARDSVPTLCRSQCTLDAR